MSQRPVVGRRNFLKGGTAAGLGLLTAVALEPNRAWGAEDAVRIVNPSGDMTKCLQYMFQNQGYFKDLGLNGTFLNVANGSQILGALVSGSADICCGGGFFSIFPAMEKGAKLKVLAGMTMTPITALYTKNPNINSVHDLVGKTVGIGAIGTLLYELMVALLQKHGVDYTKVNFVNVGSAPDILRAIIAGTVDAGVGEMDTVEEQKKYGVRMMKDGALWNELPDYTNQAFYASDATIAAKRDTLVRTLAAHAKIFRYIMTPGSKENFFAVRKIALGVDSPLDADAEWSFYQVPGRLGVDLVISKERIEYIQKLNLELGIQKKILPYEQVADMSLAHDALKLI